MIKKSLIALFFFVLSMSSIIVMRGRLLYLDAVAIGGDTSVEAKLFHILYLCLLVVYLIFTYMFFKADPEDDSYPKIKRGMALPFFALVAMALVLGVGCGVLGCSYNLPYDPDYGLLFRLAFLDRFFGDKGNVLYDFTVQLPL